MKLLTVGFLSAFSVTSFAATNDSQEKIAQDTIKMIVSDSKLLDQYKSGDLNLEQFVADNFGSRIKKVSKKIAKAGKKVASGVKNVTKEIASIANKSLSKITNNEDFMKAIRGVTKVAGKLIPMGVNALGLAAGFIPVVGPILDPLIMKASPILEKAITPDNVEKALKMAAEVARLADALLNPIKDLSDKEIEDLSGDAKVNQEVIAEITNKPVVDVKAPLATNDSKGKAVELTAKGLEALTRYVATLPKGQKAPIEVLNAIDKGAKLISVMN